MATVYLLATSDIVTDQRVHRSALTLVEAGHNVYVVGRRLKSTPPQFTRAYGVQLFYIPFARGILFYLTYNLRVIAYLLLRRVDLIYANDLDTLLGAGVISFVRRKNLVYDSHELFTELPELVHRRVKRWLWQLLERMMIRRVSIGITVSASIAYELRSRYGKEFSVVRNVPMARGSVMIAPTGVNTIIYQGALNVGRGLEKLVAAMQYVDNANLVIAGTGDIEDMLIGLARELGLTSKIRFTGRLSSNDLFVETSKATLGVSLEEDLGLNYRFALPNKLFDYIQAGIPVLVSNLPEMANLVHNYDVGQTIAWNCSVEHLAYSLNQLLHDNIKQNYYREMAAKAAKELCWEKESLLFLSALKSVVSV